MWIDAFALTPTPLVIVFYTHVFGCNRIGRWGWDGCCAMCVGGGMDVVPHARRLQRPTASGQCWSWPGGVDRLGGATGLECPRLSARGLPPRQRRQPEAVVPARGRASGPPRPGACMRSIVANVHMY